ncbi:MAG: molecular chaperone DnaK [Proteobacteria bacterium]|nr:molecular chaperone DnaK [Pseudomonadota bacterium]MBU1585162.1 molecular chaperone DnaK [Pseudomonadota bacterium]MBU2454475.1 molecular chaperone DnaK [Pseudomonadota bacterium]MBU2629052.1 molecular chaperone DnaK [Pseudomonadota bacterium]
MGRAVGVDLGTSFCVAAVIENKMPVVVPNCEGDFLTPSVFAVTNENEYLVGKAAKDYARKNPDKTVFSIKRIMGTDHKVMVNGQWFSPQQISAFILKKIKADIENYLHEEVDKAVITVPAYFNHLSRQATKEAGELAGFKVLRVISEPTAAALAYGLKRKDIKTILIWDLGGGTFDVSILELDQGFFKVKAVNGNNKLGGEDFLKKLVDHVAQEFYAIHGVDPRKNGSVHQQLKEACEKAKAALSRKQTTCLFLTSIPGKDGRMIDFETRVDRKTFEDITSDLARMMILPTKQAIKDAKIGIENIDRVLLVGGATRMACVQTIAKEFFHQDPYLKINPDEVVGLGAAVQAGILTKEIEDVVLLDVNPLSLGVETKGGLVAKIIPRNTIIPTSDTQIFTTAKINQTSMDINVLQGERELAPDNISLGQFGLTGIYPQPQGQSRVEVSFSIDANGILTVSAMDLQTDNEVSITIDSTQKLSEEMISQAITDAEEHMKNDAENKKKIETLIKAENLVTTVDEMMEEKSWPLPEILLPDLNSLVLNLKKSIEQGDVNDIETRTEQLTQFATTVGKGR